jgi:hypothetical protein
MVYGKMCKCPKCGTQLNLNSDTWTAKAQAFTMRGEDAASLETIPQPLRPTPIQIQPGAYIETPIAQQNIESNVKVPLLQSLVTGGLLGCAWTCASLYFGLPKPLLTTTGITLMFTYRTWASGVNMADSLLTRIEDYTKVDWNRDGQVGSQSVPQNNPQPVMQLVKVRSGYSATTDNGPTYQPEPMEQFINIPGMPRSKPDEDPWTVERLTDVLERAFISGRWGRVHRRELGMSQGQWSVLSKYLGPGKDGDGYNVWGTTDRPTLDAFVEQISVPVNQPTDQPTNQPE